MIMADVFTVFFIILGLWLALPALCLVLRAAWPGLTERSQRQIERHGWRSFFAGLGFGVPAFFLVAVVGSLPGAAKPIALVLGAGAFLYAFAGISGLVTHLGQRLGSPQDDARPWLATIRGAVCLEMAGTIPILGWFLICPVVLVMGAGATTIALVTGVVKPEPEDAPAPIIPPVSPLETVGAAS